MRAVYGCRVPEALALAAGKYRDERSDRIDAAHTESWSAECHFILGRVDGDCKTLRATGEATLNAAALADIGRRTPAGTS